jgi:DNA transposition AAA+ family ATPase
MAAAKIIPLNPPERNLLEVEINGSLQRIVETPDIRSAIKMLEKVKRTSERFFLLWGETGTGKTYATHYMYGYLKNQGHQVCRLCADDGINFRSSLVELAMALGHSSAERKTITQLRLYLQKNVKNVVIIYDEANYLDYKTINVLRRLGDENGATIVLSGTEILPDKIKMEVQKKRLTQFSDRIGGVKFLLNHSQHPKVNK